jgi:hypothetical protein
MQAEGTGCCTAGTIVSVGISQLAGWANLGLWLWVNQFPRVLHLHLKVATIVLDYLLAVVCYIAHQFLVQFAPAGTL